MDAITDLIHQDQSEKLYFTFKSDGLPDSELKVREFSLKEAVFAPFTLEVALVSERADLDLTAMMDKPGLITVHDRFADQKRHFHGVVASAARGDSGRRHTFYHLTLMPALHRLRFTSDSRIFQGQTVPEIIETLLKDNGVSDFRTFLTEEREPREFCVQYRETDLAFIERLMAEEGIYYYHEHREDGHTLVLSDRSTGCAKIENGEFEYNATAGGVVNGPHIRSLRWREEVRPTRVVLKDYTFKAPRAPMNEQYQVHKPPGHASDYEIYDFPGRHKTERTGETFARYRLEGLRCETSLGMGEGYCPHLQAGLAFKLREHPDKKLNREYFLVEANHHGTQPGALEEDAGIAHDDARQEPGTRLLTTFRAIPVNTPWRPEQRTKPVVDGPQMAHVVGPDGEEIYCDEHGRVKIRFQWDRYASGTDTSSCWIRVMQAWAGPMFGNIAIPRIGQEVMVEFLEGDPDQPVVAGRGYHAQNLAPYKLPDNKTRMSMKSKTHKGNGFNELRFEDENGKEELYMHAQKDMNVKVLNDRNKEVDNDQTEKVGRNKAIIVGANHAEMIAMTKTVAVGMAHTETVGLDMIINVGKNRNLTVRESLNQSVGENKTEMIGKNSALDVRNIKDTRVGKKYYIEVGEEMHIVCGKSFTIQVGQAVFRMNSDGTISRDGKTIIENATEKLELNSTIVKVN